MSEEDGWWEEEKFEYSVSAALCAAFESGLQIVEKPKGGKYELTSKAVLPHEHDLRQLRKVGPYFPPNDRYMMARTYWYDLDGLPPVATLAWTANRERNADSIDSYVDLFSAVRIDRAPIGVMFPPGRNVAIYRNGFFYPQNSGGIHGGSVYFCVKENGAVRGQVGGVNMTPDQIAVMGCAVLSFYADRKCLWNVRAVEREAHATFGVHEEQIKSLFYARDLPVTSTGRKRPILHWVASHRRRLKMGTDIDVRKHLRGIDSFEMGGTKFVITEPVKHEEKAA